MLCCMLSHSVVSNSLWPHRLEAGSLLGPRDFFQAKILEWVVISYSSGSSQGSNPHLLLLLQSRWIIYGWAIREVPGSSVVKNPPTNAGDIGSIPGSGRSPGERNDNPLQYCCLRNPMDRETWWAIVHGVEKVSDMTW